jgi:hypothetical protein
MLLVDFSKGFNRMDHKSIIQTLYTLGIPGWLLNIISSYLENRKLEVRYKDKSSEQASLPGGVGQGTILGLWLFLVMMNKYGKAHEETTIGEQITAQKNKRVAIREAKAKWVDDLTEVKNININKDTEKVPEKELVRPLPKHARTEHKIKPHMNKMHEEVTSIYSIACTNHMKVNSEKTKTILFNSSRKTDVEPLVATPNGENLEYVSETKLLGTILTDDLKTIKNTQHMVSKAYKRMWLLRRLANLTTNKSELLETYCKQIRPLVELAVPYWGTRITKHEVTILERVQKTALHIIYGENYTLYEEILQLSNLKSLADRRENLITKFAIKTYNNPKFNSWLVKKEKKEVYTRSEQQFLKEVPSRTRRYESSTIPVITKIINTKYSENFRDTYCNICNYMFTSGSNLSKHNKFKHSEETYIPEWNSRLMF